MGECAGTMPPAVTVILSTHNNAGTVRAAWDSVREQSIEGRDIEVIIVDDASDDGTWQIIQDIHDADPTVGIAQLTVNSGSAAGPRNRALALATGEYVMFLDGDDVLRPGACAVLFGEATKCDPPADVCAGQLVRRRVSSGWEQPWQSWLFQRTRTVGSVEEETGLVYDSTATGKVFRRQFLQRHELAFHEGKRFEDNEFSARAYALAEGIRIVAAQVYSWLVYPPAERVTVTSDWRSERGFADRLTAGLVGVRVFEEQGKLRAADRLRFKLLTQDVWLPLNKAIAARDWEVLRQLRAVANAVLLDDARQAGGVPSRVVGQRRISLVVMLKFWALQREVFWLLRVARWLELRKRVVANRVKHSLLPRLRIV